MLDVLVCLVGGLSIGLGLGLLPGIHPNMIILAVPLLASLHLSSDQLIASVVSLGVANAFAEFVPSVLLSAADSESGLATLPGQRLLAAGKGLLAVRLAVVGGLVSVALCAVLLAPLAIAIPALYASSRGVIWLVLAAFAMLMVVTERERSKMFWAAVCFMLAGFVGLSAFRLPINRTLVLFPIFTGLFALPHLLLQIRNGVEVPRQSSMRTSGALRSALRPAALGTLGGLLSGLLPGIGSAEIASIITVKKDDRSFLTSMGALASSNIMISFLALWLIANPRSGVAVALDQLIAVDVRAFLMMVFTVLLAAAVAAPATLWLARVLLGRLQKIDYTRLSQAILLFLVAAIALFTGPLGLLLAVTCCGLGLFVNLVGIKRGILMGVLIMPTTLFLAGV
ncbi:MAG: tripartite tricarboxylate transporter permease [Candidatus Aenigmatarchaeota archaeon]